MDQPVAQPGGRVAAEPAAPATDRVNVDLKHQDREAAESFGGQAERYDRTRQHYPDALVNRIVAASPGPDVLDVGCGTGIEARQLRAAGCNVLGVEPDARMAEFARRSGIAVEVATFEAWDSAGRDFDAVVAGMSWHWVEPVAGAAKAAQVLRPGGRFAALHHVFQYPAEILEPLIAVFQQVAPDTPINIPALRQAVDAYQQLFAKIAGGLRQAGAFGEPEQWQSGWEQTYTRDEWLEQMPTHNRLNLLPPDKLATVLEHTGAAIDAIGGSFTIAYTTMAATAVRT